MDRLMDAKAHQVCLWHIPWVHRRGFVNSRSRNIWAGSRDLCRQGKNARRTPLLWLELFRLSLERMLPQGQHEMQIECQISAKKVPLRAAPTCEVSTDEALPRICPKEGATGTQTSGSTYHVGLNNSACIILGIFQGLLNSESGTRILAITTRYDTVATVLRIWDHNIGGGLTSEPLKSAKLSAPSQQRP